MATGYDHLGDCLVSDGGNTAPRPDTFYLWHCMTEDGIQRSEGFDLAHHVDHLRCVGHRHRLGCRTAGLYGDYSCTGECLSHPGRTETPR